MGATGLMWVFHEEQRATTDLLIKVFSEFWAPSSIALRNYILGEEFLYKLQWGKHFVTYTCC